MNVRLLNYGFYFLLVIIFVLIAGPFDKLFIFLALILSLAFSYISFLLRWLSLDGLKSATVVGTLSLGFGGLEYLAYLLFFFLSSNILGKLAQRNIANLTLKLAERRSGSQVWANSFWFCIFVSLFYTTDVWAFGVAAASAMAVATADTWATIIGSSISSKAKLITNFKSVPAGTDGGVTLTGTFAALAGSASIALLFFWFDQPFVFLAATTIFISGFLGCMADSYFGALLQVENADEHKLSLTINNNIVNWLATGFGAVISLLLYNILLYALV